VQQIPRVARPLNSSRIIYSWQPDESRSLDEKHMNIVMKFTRSVQFRQGSMGGIVVNTPKTILSFSMVLLELIQIKPCLHQIFRYSCRDCDFEVMLSKWNKYKRCNCICYNASLQKVLWCSVRCRHQKDCFK
jgi:hypothetical protein